VLANPDVSAAVFGATREAHLAENVGASGLTLAADTMRRIRIAQGLTP
jgi:aryl-alcohol dehydrogenase-like predicted oxidoreductase